VCVNIAPKFVNIAPKCVNIAPKCSPNHFLSKFLDIYRGKKQFKICATTSIFKKLPKEKNRPMRENSPTLVTLPGTDVGIPTVAWTKAREKFFRAIS
jgi:hypothetical protein